MPQHSSACALNPPSQTAEPTLCSDTAARTEPARNLEHAWFSRSSIRADCGAYSLLRQPCRHASHEHGAASPRLTLAALPRAPSRLPPRPAAGVLLLPSGPVGSLACLGPVAALDDHNRSPCRVLRQGLLSSNHSLGSVAKPAAITKPAVAK